MGLKDNLEDILPSGEEFKYINLQNIPTEISPIITPESTNVNRRNDGCEYCTTVKVQNFFGLFHNEKVVFGLEVYIYFTITSISGNAVNAERLFFVSKADTNGYCDIRFNVKEVVKAYLAHLLSIDPNYYLTKIKPMKRKYKKDNDILISSRTNPERALQILSKREEKTIPLPDLSKYFLSLKFPDEFVTKISLFTRPAPHYLFSESSKNPKKHTLNGERLLKWWIQIIDDILCQFFTKDTEARLRIPGEESVRVRTYFRNLNYNKWQVGDIFSEDQNSLAVYKVPLFPDDPKSRFLHQLVEENRIMTTKLNRYWIELQERQEFKLSVTVSVLGIAGKYLDQTERVPTDLDTIRAKSSKQFNYIRSYITAEEYDNEEGASDAFTNINDFMRLQLKHELVSVVGTKPFETKKQLPVRDINITMLQPRKKPKK